jgi:hypothetical protein
MKFMLIDRNWIYKEMKRLSSAQPPEGMAPKWRPAFDTMSTRTAESGLSSV